MKIQLFKLLFISFLFVFISSVEAKVLDHIKKIEDKSDVHSMRNIDFIYMINLDQRPEKYQRSIEQLHPYGIYPYRFSAVNGWELSLETINDLGVKFALSMRGGFMGTCYLMENNFVEHHERITQYGQTYFCHCMSRGAIGIVLSHLSILQDAYDSGFDTIWVMEDDIQVIQDPNILSDLINELDKTVGQGKWDILFTDRDSKNCFGEYVSCNSAAQRPNFQPKDGKRFGRKQNIGKNFRKIGARYGAYSMIVRRSGMRKILDFVKKHQIFLPYDMDFYLSDNIRMYTVFNDVVSTTPNAISDNGEANYLNP